MYSNRGPICTLLMTRDVKISVLAREVIKLQLINKHFFSTNLIRLPLASALAHSNNFQVQHFFSVVDAADSPNTAAAQ